MIKESRAVVRGTAFVQSEFFITYEFSRSRRRLYAFYREHVLVRGVLSSLILEEWNLLVAMRQKRSGIAYQSNLMRIAPHHQGSALCKEDRSPFEEDSLDSL